MLAGCCQGGPGPVCIAMGLLLAAVIVIGWVLLLWNLRYDLRDGKLDGKHGPPSDGNAD